MTLWKQLSELHRNPDQGILFGVCAGLAEYYGWRLRTVRFVVVVLGFISSWVIVLAYAAAVFVLPTADEVMAASPVKASSKTAGPRSARYSGTLRERYQQIEKRMRRVEAYLHGKEYKLRAAFRDLESH